MTDPTPATTRVVLVTGPAGAGRSTAINALEDLGYEAIDNLPIALVRPALELRQPARGLALGIDARTRDFSANALIGLLEALATDPGLRVDLLYIDCSAEALLRRFSETRRRHPLTRADTPQEAVSQEKALLEDVRDRAELLIDTSEMSPHDLRAEVARWFAPAAGSRMRVSVHSFSYKRGIPPGLDLVFDVRFLRNPHWEPDLRARDGHDPEVAAHVAGDPRHGPFLDKVTDLVQFLLPAFVTEGKAQASIGFGCTGGRHRSVAIADHMARLLAEEGWDVSIRHWELERRAQRGASDGAGGLT
jgi:RNase adapter protein RapZ